MHELWLSRSILTLVLEATNKPVKTIHLEVGVLTGLDIPSLTMNFEVLAQNTIAAKAQFEIHLIPGLAYCSVCEKQVPYDHYGSACAHCGGLSLTLQKGEELRVKSLELN